MKKTIMAALRELASHYKLISLAVIALIGAEGQLSAQTITLSGTVHDFPSSSSDPKYNPDFENLIDGLEPGIVLPTLGADGAPVYNTAHAGGTTHGAADFAQWFHDSSATIDLPVSVTLNDAGNNGDAIAHDGVYTYSSNAFFPIDGQGYGNEAFDHNFSFTYELHTVFGYDASRSNLFTFTGDDDVWVFVNRQLAIDLGGVHEALSQTLDLNTLASAFGLVDGGNYSLDLFFAERHTSASDFTMATTLQLSAPPSSVPEPGAYGLMGASLLVSVITLRKRLSKAKV